MGIKTRFNPIGGMSSDELKDWRYEKAANGQITLYEYLGQSASIKVPTKRTVINNYTSGTTPATANTPFYNNPTAGSVDLQNVPFVGGNMRYAFYNCQNLTFVNNINPSVTNIQDAFNNCITLNQNILIPSGVTSMGWVFYNCISLNQNIQIPSSVTIMPTTFGGCTSLNQNIQIPAGVTSVSYAFSRCSNLNQNIQIPSSVTSMYGTFQSCTSLNQNIQIPSSVTSMFGTFAWCTNYSQNISNLCNGRTSLYDAEGAFQSTKIANASHCFAGCTSLTSVTDVFNNCQYLKDISFTFERTKISTPPVIPDSVTNMHGTFYQATSLTYAPHIPTYLADMTYAFSGCTSIAQNVAYWCEGYTNLKYADYCFQSTKITSAYRCFLGCTNLTSANAFYGCTSLTNMAYTFYGCSNLNQNIYIPSSVTSLAATFYGCTKLNQNIQIPSSVTSTTYTFHDCHTLNQNIQIPSSVTTMYGTFYNCPAISGKNIVIRAAGVTDATQCFYGASASKNVIFPLRYINNVNTATRNSLVSAGYAVGTCIGNAVSNTTQSAVFTAWDPIAWEGYNTWYGNGTHWLLNKWAAIGSKAGTTAVTVPNSITSYATYSTAIVNTCFAANKTITSVNCNNTPFYGTSSINTFRNCTALTSITRVKIPTDMTVIYGMFCDCSSATMISSGAGTSGLANPDIPNSVTNCQALYAGCKSISNFHINSYSTTIMQTCFDNVNTRALNIWVRSPNVGTITNCFRNHNKSYRKNVYIYFKYANGVGTKTFNSFCTNLYMGNTNKSNFANPRFNAISNFYFYNLGTSPI